MMLASTLANLMRLYATNALVVPDIMHVDLLPL